MPTDRRRQVDRRRAQVAARSRTATEAARARDSELPKGLTTGLLIAGGILVALGVASLVHLWVLGVSGVALSGIYPFRAGEADVAVPAVFFLLATGCLIMGVLLRRAKWESQQRGFVRGGSVATRASGRTRLVVVLGWLVVAVAAWAALVVVPTSIALGRDGMLGGDGFWTLTKVYGFLAAAIAGIIVISLVKRWAHDRAAALGREAPKGGRDRWRIASAQWRAESWLGAIGAGFLGSLPFLWQDAAAREGALDTTAVTIFIAIGVVGLGAGALVALGSWRTGEGFGYAESVS